MGHPGSVLLVVDLISALISGHYRQPKHRTQESIVVFIGLHYSDGEPPRTRKAYLAGGAGLLLGFADALAGAGAGAWDVVLRRRFLSRFFACDRLRVFSRALSLGAMIGTPSVAA